MDDLVQLSNVTKRYDGQGAAAVDDVSLRVTAGEAGPPPRRGRRPFCAPLAGAGAGVSAGVRRAAVTA